ncbi:MAG: hypothetical protein ABIT16_12385 [Croceibacterium sp.]
MSNILHSDFAQINGLSNIPDDPDLAIEVGFDPFERLKDSTHRKPVDADLILGHFDGDPNVGFGGKRWLRQLDMSEPA